MSFLPFHVLLRRQAYAERSKDFTRCSAGSHKVYTVGSFFGFFVAGYTGVLVNTTARPLWEATDPLYGPIFIASAASTGAAAIALTMAWRKSAAQESFDHLERFDRVAMIIELALIAVMLVVAGRYAAPLLTGFFGFVFLGGAVLVGVLLPLWLTWQRTRAGTANESAVMVAGSLVLFGGLMLRISLGAGGPALGLHITRSISLRPCIPVRTRDPDTTAAHNGTDNARHRFHRTPVRAHSSAASR
jgi:formate-dependent nitrite reductase membrane component NrfD